MNSVHWIVLLSLLLTFATLAGTATMLFLFYRRNRASLRLRTEELSAVSRRLASSEDSRSNVGRELAEQELRFKQMVECIPVGVLMLDNKGRFTFANTVAARLFHTIPESILGKHYWPESVDWKVYQMDGTPLREQDNPFTIVLRSNLSVSNAEYQFIWPDEKTSRLSISAAPLYAADRTRLGVIASVQDLTDLAETQAELEVHRVFFEQMFLQSSSATQIFDRNGNRQRANAEWCRLFNVEESELATLAYNIFEDQQVVGAGLVPGLKRVLEYGISAEWEVLFPSRPSSRNTRWLQIRAQPIRSARSGVTHMIVQYEDITEKKRIEEQTQKSLREKELLLKEVHHRVKNNMQLMKSMLHLQAGYVTDEQTLSMLTDSASRINAMALIHEKLYQSEEFGSVEINSYLTYVSDSLYQTYVKPGLEVHIETDLEHLFVDIDTAIPCGLLANELMSNALKHAFVGRSNGTVRLSFHPCAPPEDADSGLEWHELRVSDNGTGIPSEGREASHGSLGLKLVDSLVKQLRGTLEVDSRPDSGTDFSIRFPRPRGTIHP